MPSVYKASTYAAAALWLDESKVKYRPNPKSGKSFDRYASYEKAKTIGEALSLGSKTEDLLFDFERGHLQVSPPFRRKPLDLNAITNFEQLTYADVALHRFAAYTDPTRPAPSEKIMGELKDRFLRLRGTRKRLNKLSRAKELGVQNVQDLNDKGFWESPETYARRVVAEQESKDILAAVALQGRGVSDHEVLRVLRLWGFRTNETRKNVMREGQTYVLSDTIGVTTDRTGHSLRREESRLYPEFNRLMCRWLLDNLPQELRDTFSFTSVNINKNYAGRLHRDKNNVGPSILRAFGDFTQGQLNYYPQDDKKLRLEELAKRPELRVKLDVSSGTLLFDGCRAHEVDDFKGERYSLVYFTCARFWRLPAADRSELSSLGFRFPARTAIGKLRSLLAPPTGYRAGGKARTTTTTTTAAAAKGRSAAAKRSNRQKAGGAPFRFWPVAADPAKVKLERSAARFWAKRPPRDVPEERALDAQGHAVARERKLKEGWHYSCSVLLGPTLTSHRNLELKGYRNVVDAAAALNGGKVEVPRAIQRAGYCVTYSIRTRAYYLLYLDALRDKALAAFGLGRAPALKKARTG